MNWDDVIYPVDITYNRDYMLETVKRIKHWPSYTNDRGKTFFSTHRDIYFPINAEAIKVKNSLLRSTTFSFSHVPPGHETGWHSDLTRGCTLILPIDYNPHLIKFKIDNVEYDYYYHTPVITNAKSYHNGVNHTQFDRYNLLFHFDDDYQSVVNAAKNDRLEFKWKQDYNICLTFEFPMLDRFYYTHSDLDNCSIVITDSVEIAKQMSNKFVIIIGHFVETASSILIGDSTLKSDIVNAVKYILDSSCTIKRIDLK